MIKYFEEQTHYLFYKSTEQDNYITFCFKCSYLNGKMQLSYQIILAMDMQNVKESLGGFSNDIHREAAEAYLNKCDYKNFELIREIHFVKMNDQEYSKKVAEERKEDLANHSNFEKLNEALSEINQYQYKYLFWTDYYEGMSDPSFTGTDFGIKKSNSWGEGIGDKKEQLVTKVVELDCKNNITDLTGNGTMDIHDYVRLMQGCYGCYIKHREG